MDHDYFLRSERVGFSTWNESDRELAYSLWGNPEVSKLISKSGVFSNEQVEARFNLEMNNLKEYGIQYWPLFELENGEFMGVCGLKPKSEDALEIGCQLLPKYWKQGYATECSRAVIDYAFNTLGVKKIFAGHHPKNEGSQRTLTKLGFTYIGDEFYEPTGLNHPSYEMKNPNL